MKNYIKYLGLVSIGILLGWLLFGNSEKTKNALEEQLTQAEVQQYTCSMHPQIMQNEAGDCPICGMDLIPMESSSDGLSVDEFRMSENALALANIQTTKVQSGISDPSNLVLTGKIKTNEKTNSVQTAHFAGRIEKLFVNSTGEKVYKGQLLATMYSPELVTAQKELLTAQKSRQNNSQLYEAVKNKLKLWKLSDDQIAKIENSNEILTTFPIYANVNGIVTTKLIDEGNYVKEGAGLFMISDLNTVWADFDAYEKQIPLISIGDEILIKTNSNPNEEIKARISFIDPLLNVNTRTVVVRAELNNNHENLKPGMFIQGTLNPSNTTSLSESMITIPKTAVLWTGKRSVVYVRKQGVETIFEMREISIGQSVQDTYEVLEGLSENEEIVTNGTFSVDAAAQLLGKKSMMNTDKKTSSAVPEEFDNQNIIELIKQDRIETSSDFKQQLQLVYDAYIETKDALVLDDAAAAKQFATGVPEYLALVENDLLSNEEAKSHWKTLEKTLKASSLEISKTDDITIQREQFYHLSNAMIASLKLFGIEQQVFVQYCPMANKDKGAFWLSNEEKIMNPYFGDMMLNCGNVDSIINN